MGFCESVFQSSSCWFCSAESGKIVPLVESSSGSVQCCRCSCAPSLLALVALCFWRSTVRCVLLHRESAACPLASGGTRLLLNAIIFSALQFLVRQRLWLSLT